VAWIVVTDWGRHRFWLTLGFTWPKSFGPWKCVGLAVLLLGFGALLTNFFGGSKTQLDLLIESSYQTRVATAFLAAATGPFVEELVYRGILYSALQRVVGVSIAVVLVSVLFAGVHVFQYYNNLAVIAVITLLSVTLTVVRAATGRLLPSFMIHLIFNGIQSLILVLQPFFEKANTVVPNKLPATNLIETVLRHLS
jgi:membrane protease YdiL (CAAX protease family)